MYSSSLSHQDSSRQPFVSIFQRSGSLRRFANAADNSSADHVSRRAFHFFSPACVNTFRWPSTSDANVMNFRNSSSSESTTSGGGGSASADTPVGVILDL